MKVFISWSGTRSRKTALLLRTWLKHVINEVDPWMSDEDLAKGGDWSSDIREQLNGARFGIVCVTPGNKSREWLLFEAGALSRQVNDEVTRVAPLLIGFTSKRDLSTPLSRFQVTMPDKEDMFKLIKSINEICASPRPLDELQTAFDIFWPHFEDPFKKIEAERPASSPRRTKGDSEVLDELLDVVRNMQRQLTVTEARFEVFTDYLNTAAAQPTGLRFYPQTRESQLAREYRIRRLRDVRDILKRHGIPLGEYELRSDGRVVVQLSRENFGPGSDLEAAAKELEKLGLEFPIEFAMPLPGEESDAEG